MNHLLIFLDPFPEGTHVIIVNEEKESLFNSQKGDALYNQRMDNFKNAVVLKVLPFKNGIKIMVGHHES